LDAVEWSHHLDPAPVGSSSYLIHLVEGVITVLRLPKEASHRIKCQAETIAAAVRKNLVDVRHNVIQFSSREDDASVPFKLLDVSHFHIGERIIIRSCAVRIEPEDASRQMGVVGSRSTELIIRLSGSERTAFQVLQLSAAPVIADLEVQFAIGAEQDFPTI